MKISNENVKYYASLVGYYSVHRLRQLNEGMVYVYLLCFVQHRYQKLHDNLIQSLIYHVRRHSDEAKAAAKEQVYTWRVASNADLQKAGRVLRLFTDDSVAESEPFGEVRIKAFAVLEPARLNSVANYMATKARFDEIAFQWEHIDRAAPSFKRHIRPILQGVEFATPFTDDPLIEAVHFLKAAFRKGKPLGHYVDADLPHPMASRTSPSVTCISKRRSGTEACCPIGMNFSFTSNYAKVSKPARSSAETVSVFAASRTTWWMTSSGEQREKLLADTGLARLAAADPRAARRWKNRWNAA